MTFWDVLFWIFIAIVLYILFKISIVLLIVAVILIVVFYLANGVVNLFESFAHDSAQQAANAYVNSQLAQLPNTTNTSPKISSIHKGALASISEYCVNKKLREFDMYSTGYDDMTKLSVAITQCQTPARFN